MLAFELVDHNQIQLRSQFLQFLSTSLFFGDFLLSTFFSGQFIVTCSSPFCSLPLACSLWLAASYDFLAVCLPGSNLSLVFSFPAFRLRFFPHLRLFEFPYSAFCIFHWLLMPSLSVWDFLFYFVVLVGLSSDVSALPCLPHSVAYVRPHFSFFSSYTPEFLVLLLCIRCCSLPSSSGFWLCFQTLFAYPLLVRSCHSHIRFFGAVSLFCGFDIFHSAFFVFLSCLAFS